MRDSFKIDDWIYVSWSGTPPPPQPSSEQAAVIKRLRESRDPWKQLGVPAGCGKDDVNRAYR